MRLSRKIIPILAAAPLAATLLALALLAAGCSASHPAGHPAATSHRSGDPRRSTPARTRRPQQPPNHFTVTGAHPVQPNSSQDTHAQAAGAVCQRGQFRQDQSLGQTAATGFSLTGATVAAQLLAHFLSGTGTPVRFGPRSPIARQARASRPFRALNQRIQADIQAQLRARRTRVQVPAAALTPILFARPGSSQDLELGFRGTQGLDLTGAGTITRHRYTGTLTYLIRDSYGFPPRDQLLGIGTDMRYLQVACGHPPTRGGARWFPDTIAVTVPFRHSIN